MPESHILQLQYLRPKTGSYEGGSAGGASPAAHGVPDGLIQLFQPQDSMKRSLERTRQSWKHRFSSRLRHCK